MPDEVKVVMDEMLKSAFEGIRENIKSVTGSLSKDIGSVATLVKHNYTNIKNDISRLENTMTELKDNWQKDHDKIIKIEQEIANQAKELIDFKESEKKYGKEIDKRVSIAEGKLEKVSLSIWKLVGLAIGSGATVGLFFTLLLKLFSK